MPIYGIDLGTTNSLIGCDNKILCTVPSVVDLNTGAAGQEQYNNPDATRNYKVDMQTTHYGVAAVACSKYVLMQLKRGAGLDASEPIDAVISVPAYFSGDQCDATRLAAKQANINVKALIKEPTAAALFINKDRDGMSAIFDLGGGTFDVAIIKSEGGKHTVIATDGCILGGRDLDNALVELLMYKYNLGVVVATSNDFLNEVIKAKMFRANSLNALKHCKVKCPPNNAAGVTEVELSFSDYIKTVIKVFGKSAILTKNVLRESGVNPAEVQFCFVGGSTHCDFLRIYIEQCIGVKSVPDTYDRDAVVGKGAVYYASLIEQGAAIDTMCDVSKQLSISVNNSIPVIPIINKNTSLPASASIFKILSKFLEVQAQEYNIKVLYGDSIFAPKSVTGVNIESNNVLVGETNFRFVNEVKSDLDTSVTINATIDASGNVTVSIEEPLEEEVVIKGVVSL